MNLPITVTQDDMLEILLQADLYLSGVHRVSENLHLWNNLQLKSACPVYRFSAVS